MRPYLAIIKDSFRAALHSQVLYVMLAIITLLLLVIAPLHVREVLDWEIDYRDNVTRPHDMVVRIMERKDDADHPEMAHVWSLLSAPMQEKLTAVYTGQPDTESADDEESSRPRRRRGPPRRTHPGLEPGQSENNETYRDLVRELNGVIENGSIYRAEDWETRRPGIEADELIESGTEQLTDERRRRLNRLLVANAFGTALESGSATSLDFHYAIWKWFSWGMTLPQFVAFIAPYVSFIFDKFVLSVGIAIAILITANIIPETFEPGSLNLLLSKPVSRALLLVAKFFGGCAFVALCSIYLFSGLFLWMGLAINFWDYGLLFGIPIYVLTFAIYYSVSAVVGLIFRSPILSIILTVFFWGICFAVGSIYMSFGNRMENLDTTRIESLPGEQLMLFDGVQRPYVWNQNGRTWDQSLSVESREDLEVALGVTLFFGSEFDELPAPLGPVYDRSTARIFTTYTNPVDPASFMGRRGCFASLPGETELSRYDFYPSGTLKLLPADNGLLCVTNTGSFFRVNAQSLAALDESRQTTAGATGEVVSAPEATSVDEPAEPSEETNADIESPDDGKPDQPPGNSAEKVFDRIPVDHPVLVRSAGCVSLNRSNQCIAVYRRGTITIFQPDEDGYCRAKSVDVDTGVNDLLMSATIEYQGDTILLALGNGQVITLDGESLQERNGYLPQTGSGLDHIRATEDGRYFGLVYASEEFWMLDTQNDSEIKRAPFSGNGSISAIGFDGNDRIWVADRQDRVTLYDLESGDEVKRLTPGLEWIPMIHRYLVEPLYTVFPKPGEMYRVVSHLSNTSATAGNLEVDLGDSKPDPGPWSPLWSGFGFMCFMLLVGCVYFNFKDF